MTTLPTLDLLSAVALACWEPLARYAIAVLLTIWATRTASAHPRLLTPGPQAPPWRPSTARAG